MTKPVVRKRHWLSAIWLLPLISALLGGWAIYQNMQEKGIEISILFQDAAGIREGKTAIMYKGVRIGMVKKIHMSDDFKQVRVIAEIQQSSMNGLKDSTQFWLVKPKVSITEITGLDTIVSGNYISINPGKGNLRTEFIALESSPALDDKTKGLYINILADHLGSVSRGAKVYFREIPVGEVLDYELAKNHNGVVIKLRIEQRYINLVKKSSRFWNASGLSVKANLSGLSVHMESLAALIVGGISFYTPDTNSDDYAINEDSFKLYGDFDSAKVGINVNIKFESAIGLEEGVTEVKYDAFKIGIVKKISYKKTGKSVVAEVMFDPRAEELLKQGTRFWLDKPKFSLADFSGLSSLLQGRHIKMQLGEGKPSRDFKALTKPPLILSGDKGVHLVLKANSLDSIEYGSPVLYKKIQVGQVHDFKLSKKGDEVLIYVHISERYKHLVSKQSRFWNASGVRVSVGTQGLDVQTGTVGTLLSGGVEFITPKLGTRKIKNGRIYTLYKNKDQATDNGLVGYSPKKNVKIITLKVDELGSLSLGSKVYFKKLPVGEIVHYALSASDDSITMWVEIEAKFKHLVKNTSRFWRNSGLKVEGGLSGVKVELASVHALLNGGISFTNTDLPKTSLNQFSKRLAYPLYASKDEALESFKRIDIHFSLAQGIQAGTKIKYLGVPVGEVIEVKLASNNKAIIASAKLLGSAMQFARSGTQFRLVSAQLSLFNTKHLDTIVTGNYLAIEPGEGTSQTVFQGHLDSPEIKHGLHLVLKSPRLGSIKAGNNIYYRQVKVGEVRSIALASPATHVLMDVYIAPRYAPLVQANSKFWNISGIKVDIGLFTGTRVQAESMESIISGGISFATPNTYPKEKMRSGQIFELANEYQNEWLGWQPEIELQAL